MNLLQTTWLDIICLNVAYRSTPYKGVLVYADDFKISEADSPRFASHLELDGVTRKLAQKFSELKLNKEEYMLVKAMLLLNPDIPSLESADTVQQLRDRMHDSLLEFEKGRGQNAARRVSHLLFCMPMLMHEKLLATQFWVSIKKQGQVPLHKLLSEMLEFATS
ncbi:unnamed protein product [Dimorphilus gyrociliatus]|uniref:NR LBD domain-containing protein n=1 Tax=Dimorphilus gyrociliatus TaxID=2664684 RepID=A0A7I8VDE8_9ANNE|nr:unnamed protein product [Dimorphilus gyrociliatus]